VPNVVVAAPLLIPVQVDGANIEVLPAEAPPQVFAAAVRAADAVITLVKHKLSAELLSTAPRLRVIGNCAVGVDNIDVAKATELGICVTNTPDVLTEATADCAFALLLAAARHLAEGDRLVRSGQWRGWAPDLLLGVDVWGKTLGIIGMGRIGRAMARRALGFGMRVLFSGGASDESTRAAEPVALAQLWPRADFVSLHCPLTPATRGVINAASLAQLPSHAVVVNTARGECIDEDDLADALEQRRIFAAGLDVFVGEPAVHPRLRGSDHVVLAPHLGSATTSVRTQMAQLAMDGVRSVLAGTRPAHLVNPGVWAHRRGQGA
jgi:glyoxylate reductase